MSKLNVGGHLSLNGRPRETVQWAAENGFNSLQIFASSPGAWKPPAMPEEMARDLIVARAECGVEPLVIHAIYLINLASHDPALAGRSRSSLVATLRAGQRLGAAGVITHIGSHGGRGYESVADQVASALQAILEATPDGIDLVLENSAGAGGLLGSDLFELGDLIRRAGAPARLRVALDTAHLCAAGWDFAEPGTAERLMETLAREVGADRLAVIHANDSLVPCGSRRDRHTNIGEGFIGMGGFAHLLAQPLLTRVPWILETPNLEHRIADQARLRGLAEGPCEVARGA